MPTGDLHCTLPIFLSLFLSLSLSPPPPIFTPSHLLIFFKGSISGAITSGIKGPVQDALKGLINTNANKALSSFSLLVGIPFPAPYDISEVRVEEMREIGGMGAEVQRV